MFFRKFPRQTLIVLLATILALTGCNFGATPAPTLDINAINTAIVGTTVSQFSAQFTQTALAAPTSTPLPTETAQSLPTTDSSGALPTISFEVTTAAGITPIPGFTQLASPAAPATSSGQVSTANGCNDALFIGETIPDKTEFNPGKDFSKAWQLQNTGTCTWDDGYTFAFLADVSSPDIEGYDIVYKASDKSTKPGASQSFIVKLTAPSTSGEYFGYWKLKDDAGNFFGPRVYLDIIVK